MLLAMLAAPAALLAQEPPLSSGPPDASAPPVPEPAPPAEVEPSEPIADPGDSDETPPAPATLAVAAGAGGVTMADFSFSPASITVSAGDTVTWTNSGPDEPHTATANDGSFDTGEVAVGSSASHTFTSAGTFPYVCSIHPDQMRGTVIVEAAGGAGGGGGTGPSDETGAPGSTASEASAAAAPDAAGTGSKLPSTGLSTVGLGLIGLAAIAAGAWLRRRAHLA